MAGPFSCSFFPVLFIVIAIAVGQVSAHRGNVAAPIPVSVAGLAGNAVPILLQSQDYEGPYDPLDPQGVAAAQRRGMAVAGKYGLDAAASYIPPGAIEMLTKDLKKVIINEGKRFALHHPVEATELVGIAGKLMALVKTAAHKVKAEGKKEAISNLHH